MVKHGVLIKFCVALGVSLLLSGCGQFIKQRHPGEIPVTLSHMDRSSCPMSMTVSDKRWLLNYLGMYVSNPEVRIDGRWQALNFVPNKWQTKKVALLKFHGLCGEKQDGNDRLLLDASEKLMKLATNLRVTVGLPFSENHSDPASQPTPLNDNSMFLSRQSGHLFIRLDLEDAESQHPFSYHLGSVGCDSPAAEQAPTSACQFTNRVEMILPTTQLDTELDLALSVPTMVAQVNMESSDGCVFGPPENEVCSQLLHNLLHRPWLDWQ